MADAEKWCAWPIFDGVPVGIPKMQNFHRSRYARAEYDNVAAHRLWIEAQPYGRRNNPERSVLDVLDSGDYTVRQL